MPRYSCSTCKGTLDINGGNTTCPRDGKALTLLTVPSVGRATGCHYSKEAFLRMGFKYPHYVPSTGRGKFDCLFSPRSGEIGITVKFGAVFEAKWKERFKSDEKAALLRDYTDGVPQYWNGKYVFRCTREGWTDITVRPRFRVTFGDVVGAHFKMVVTREDARARQQHDHGRECRGFVSINQVTSGDTRVQDRMELRDFQMRDFNHSVGGLQTAGNDREAIEKFFEPSGITVEKQKHDVDTGGRTDRFPVEVGLLPFADNSADPAALRTRLALFAGKVRQMPDGSHPVPLVIKGLSKTTETGYAKLARDRAEAVRSILASLPNPLKIADPGTGHARVDVRPDLDYEWSFKRNERQFDYNVAAHEFGHLLGLPDEYENPVAGDNADAATTAKAKVKTNFLLLTGRAGQRSPTFPSHTSSMMSDGMTVMPWHYVTVWEALANMTAGFLDADEWEIMAAGG